MKEYKHYTTQSPGFPVERELNGFAEKGWQVVSSFITSSDFIHVILEREKNEGPRLA